MKALITGITGSGGSYLAEFLCQMPDVKVYGTTRQTDLKNNKNIEKIYNKINIINVDMSDFGSLLTCIDQAKPDVIFHIASIADVKESFLHPYPIVVNNISITLNLLEAVRLLKEKSGYNPIIQVCSTSEIYGNVNGPIKEDCVADPRNPYAASKLTQDVLGHVYYLNFGLKIIRTRMFSYFNAKRSNLFASNFAIQIKNIKEGRAQKLKHGNLHSIRTLLDVRDAAEAYWLAATQCDIGEVYNIGGSELISVGDVLKLLIDRSGINIETETDKNLLRPVDIDAQIPDSSKFQKKTGWEQKYNLRESVDFFSKEIEYYW
jgi:GDP-4-dehydro-6-deoxy-D-mannose reductase